MYSVIRSGEESSGGSLPRLTVSFGALQEPRKVAASGVVVIELELTDPELSGWFEFARKRQFLADVGLDKNSKKS